MLANLNARNFEISMRNMPVAFEAGNFETSKWANVFERDKKYSKKIKNPQRSSELK